MSRHRITLFIALASLVIAAEAFAAGGPPPFVTGQPTPVIVTNPNTAPAPVIVTNPPTATAPDFNVNLNDPGRIPYQVTHGVSTQTDDCSTSQDSCSFLFPDIPMGKRLVVQHVTASVRVDKATYVFVEAQNIVVEKSLVLSAFLLPLSVNIGQPQRAAGDQSVQFYLDSGKFSGAAMFVSTDGNLGPAPQIIVSMTGYLLDCTINQCAAIAP